MEQLDAWFRHGPGWWWLAGALAAWVVYGWLGSAWRRRNAKRRRREFDAREERRWQGHRRNSNDVKRLHRDR